MSSANPVRIRSTWFDRRAVAPGFVLFAIMVAHALLETARDALFLSRLGPGRLAWAYVAIAAVALGAVFAMRRWTGARDPRRLLVTFLAIAGVGTGMLAFAITQSRMTVFVLYVWTGLVATLVIPSFWLVIDRSLRIGDAKKMFAAIGAGGTLGALAGSTTAAALGQMVAPEHLVTIAAAMFLISAAAAFVLAPRELAPAPVREIRAKRVRPPHRTRRYTRVLLVLALISTGALTLGDLMFKRMLAERLSGDDLASVFGATYAGLNVIGLVIQLVVTPRLLERFGVGGVLSVLPIIVLATALGFVFTGGLIAVIALKLGDGGLRHSVHRVASEILFLPLSGRVRDSAKPVIDAVGQRGGQVLAALLTFVVASDAGGTRALGVMTALAVVAWLVVIVLANAGYVQMFRDTLDAGEIQRDVRIPTLNGDAVSLLTSSLASPDESEALAALDLLARRGGRIPALVLYHPSSAVVRRAIALIDGEVRVDVARVLAQLTNHADPLIRAAALGASSRTGHHRDLLVAALDDREPDVRAAAAVGLAGTPAAVADGRLDEMLSGTVEQQAALARAIGRVPRERFRHVLDQLAASRSPEVLREVLRVWALAPALADVDRLIQMLADPRVRADARSVFARTGSVGSLDRLIAALDDARTPLGVRRHLPRTISRFRAPAAAAALVDRLLREPDGATEFKILRALGRMRADRPMLALDLKPIEAYAVRSISDAARYSALAERLTAEGLAPTPGSELLVTLMTEKRRQAIERVFRAFGILYPLADMRSVHDAITSIDDDRRAVAQELLESYVPAHLRLALLEVIDQRDRPSDQSMTIYPTYEDLLAALLSDPSNSLRSVAAHHVAERKLVALRGVLLRLRPVISSDVVLHSFDQAIERLDA